MKARRTLEAAVNEPVGQLRGEQVTASSGPNLSPYRHFNRDEWALGLRNNPKYPGWKADFDWFIKPASIVRFIEGRFGGKSSAAPAQSARETYSEDIDRR